MPVRCVDACALSSIGGLESNFSGRRINGDSLSRPGRDRQSTRCTALFQKVRTGAARPCARDHCDLHSQWECVVRHNLAVSRCGLLESSLRRLWQTQGHPNAEMSSSRRGQEKAVSEGNREGARRDSSSVRAPCPAFSSTLLSASTPARVRRHIRGSLHCADALSTHSASSSLLRYHPPSTLFLSQWLIKSAKTALR